MRLLSWLSKVNTQFSLPALNYIRGRQEVQDRVLVAVSQRVARRKLHDTFSKERPQRQRLPIKGGPVAYPARNTLGLKKLPSFTFPPSISNIEAKKKLNLDQHEHQQIPVHRPRLDVNRGSISESDLGNSSSLFADTSIEVLATPRRARKTSPQRSSTEQQRGLH